MLISWTVDTICPLLERGERLAMATVISKSGSAPCMAGSKLILQADGTCFGTIGGGVLEAEALRQAREVLRTGVSRHFIFDLTGRDAASMAMICGGRVEVFVEHIAADSATLEVFQRLATALRTGEPCVLVSDLGPADTGLASIERCLSGAQGLISGPFRHGSEALAQLVQRARGSVYPLLTGLGDRRFLVERCFIPAKVILFGAGHVSQCVADLVQRVEFQVLVLDDRPEFANRERFPSADEIRVIPDFEHCLEDLELDADSFAVIVTRGHSHDRTVLEQVLRTRAGYVGMLGSRKKSLEIRKALAASGFAPEDLARIHCPIGLDIAAETTGEIAFSIVAELIQDRAWKRT
jgi:xanthine dehydrogenase accessory factor